MKLQTSPATWCSWIPYLLHVQRLVSAFQVVIIWPSRWQKAKPSDGCCSEPVDKGLAYVSSSVKFARMYFLGNNQCGDLPLHFDGAAGYRTCLRAAATRYGSSVLPISNQEFATLCCRSTLHHTFQKRVWLCSHWEGKRRFSKWIWQHRQQHWLLPLEWGLWEMIYRVKVLSLLSDKKQDRFHVETRANTSNGKLSGHLVPLLT